MRIEAVNYPHNPTLRAISARQRRAILTFLLEHDSPVTIEELVDQLRATEQMTSVIGEPIGERESVHANFIHSDLPILETAGLISWDHETETVTTTSHPALDDPRFQQLLRTEMGGLDDVLVGLSHEHRRIVLNVVREAPKSVTLTDLAREIRRREPELMGRQHPSVDELLTSLHHLHLPKLTDTGLIDYDRATNRATYTENTALETVFEIIYAPSECTVDKLDEFLRGLCESYQSLGWDADEQLEWPHYWREPYHG